jgi:hypothetical protein
MPIPGYVDLAPEVVTVFENTLPHALCFAPRLVIGCLIDSAEQHVITLQVRST